MDYRVVANERGTVVGLLDLVVARQAIFDRDLDVVAYELLFRHRLEAESADTSLDGSLMTANVLFTTLNLGIDRLVGDKMMFCNADYAVLTGAVPIMLPPERTVIEILETVTCDDAVVEGCLRLLGMGYQLALDDFTFFEGAQRLLELVSIVKIDLRQVAPTDLAAMVTRCRDFDVRLLAEKIETEAELTYCLELGFDFFQGYALERPRTMSGRTLSGSQVGAARIAASLLSTEFEVTELEEIIQTDPGLAYQLLQLAGTGARHGLRRPVRTLRDAVILVGPGRTQSWLALLMMRQQTGTPPHNLTTALVRAKMCELLTARVAPRQGSFGFTAGVLSSFEELLGVDPGEIITSLAIDEDLREAAFGSTTLVARIVRDVIDYQTWPTEGPRRSGLSDLEFDSASIRALAWAVEASRTIEDSTTATPPDLRPQRVPRIPARPRQRLRGR